MYAGNASRTHAKYIAEMCALRVDHNIGCYRRHGRAHHAQQNTHSRHYYSSLCSHILEKNKYGNSQYFLLSQMIIISHEMWRLCSILYTIHTAQCKRHRSVAVVLLDALDTHKLSACGGLYSSMRFSQYTITMGRAVKYRQIYYNSIQKTMSNTWMLNVDYQNNNKNNNVAQCQYVLYQIAHLNLNLTAICRSCYFREFRYVFSWRRNKPLPLDDS